MDQTERVLSISSSPCMMAYTPAARPRSTCCARRLSMARMSVREAGDDKEEEDEEGEAAAEEEEEEEAG